ncbi:hypothetical protein [Calothrix sp. PCC 7507]|uniref:hypothetical protein n=1 Tax=Calothrix sp. PCC 7507 TaxID=99598 RepID=UPI00029F1A08|nr:hypothetical protein [Calothrix sp. PCC 7507]AFY31366.1 hypothetical protein Cal7507_0885 [Calothrix sp. PCC 7507]
MLSSDYGKNIWNKTENSKEVQTDNIPHLGSSQQKIKIVNLTGRRFGNRSFRQQ